MPSTPLKIRGKNKWERRHQEFLAGPWVTRDEYIKEKKICNDQSWFVFTRNWEYEKNELLLAQTEQLKIHFVEQGQPIKIAAFQGKTKIIEKLYQEIMDDSIKKDLKTIAFAYHVFKVELGEPENITRNLNESPENILPDDLLDKLKESALNTYRDHSDIPRDSDSSEAARLGAGSSEA